MRLDAQDLMENSRLRINRPKKHNNATIIGIIIAIIITLLIIFIIMAVIKQVQPVNETMKIYIDGTETQMDTSIFLIEDNKVYVSVKKIASFIGYESHSGEYKIEAEDVNKVFVENKQETASMFLNSTTISKIEPNVNEEYKNYTMSEPAKNVNGDIYVISDGIETACNLIIQYDSSNNTMNIQTLSYIFQLYDTAVKNMGFTGVSNNFENQKALLYDRIVIENSDGRYGVINSKGEEVIGTRYAYIQFDEYNEEFAITNAYDKIGIDYINGETKINVNYDEIKSIDKEKGLYLVKNNSKYGIIGSDERIIIHIEYDDIGVDISPYTTQIRTKATTSSSSNTSTTSTTTENKIIKQYVFYDSIIAVKQNNMWGFFDIKGNKITDIKYTGIGCKAKVEQTNKNNNQTTTSKTKTTSNLLLIEEYELVVIEQNEKYGLINTSGKELFRPAADDMYSITDAGVKSYYMLYNGNVYNLEEDIFKQLGLRKKTET